MKSKNIFVAAFIFSMAVTSINSQTKIKTEANADIVEYTSKEGLPTTNFSKIVQTNDGYIWLSGIEGTYRFDGYDFDDIGKEYGVPKMQNMYYDSTKNILYFASPKKFISFDGEKFTVYTEKEGYKINGLSGQIISLLNADSRGRIWLGSYTPFVDKKFNGGLTMFHNGKFTVYDSTTFPLHNAKNFIETPYGDIIFNSFGRNTQSSEESYIALFKDGNFKKIDESEGVYLQNARIVSQSFATSIDKNGNTWIAFAGVNIYSGNNFFNDKNTAGVLMYDGNNFHQYPGLTELNKSSEIPALISYSKDLDKLFLTTLTIKPTLFDRKNNNIFELKNGKWIKSDFFKKVKLVNDLNPNKKTDNFYYNACFLTKANKYFPELLVFTTININQSQSYSYPNQFFTYKNNSWEKYDAFSGIPNSELKDGYLIKSQKGFSIYYPNKSKMLTEKDGLLFKQAGISMMQPDRRGILWMSYSYTALPTYAEINRVGINIWDGKKLISYTEEEGLKSNITFNIFQDSKYRVWIPTDKGITKAREIKNSEGNWIFKFENVSNKKGNNYNVTNVFETSNGDIYAWQNYVRPAYAKITQANFYLAKYDGNKFVEIKSPFNSEENAKKYQLISLKESINGNLWIEGIFADNKKDLTSAHTKILLFDGNKWLPPPESWNIPKEQLYYVGTLKNGMYFLTVGGFYNFNGKEFVNLSDSVDANADFRLLKGASVTGTFTNIQAGERLYIRLRGRGLVIFDGKHLNFYNKKDGLPSTDISNPIIDFKGNVTFGFPFGALVINGDKFQAYYDDESIVSGGTIGAAKDPNGNIAMFYPGTGLYIRNTENKSYALKISAVAVDAAYFFNNYPSEFSHSQKSFQFSYAALNFKDPGQTKYERFLEGYDNNWSRPNKAAFAEYQNLSPGKYTLKVRGITSNGVKTNEASYSFVINPPLWKTWWAYSFYVLFLGFGLVRIRNYEKRKMKLKEATRLRKERSEARIREAELRAKAAEAQSKLIQTEHDRKTKELEEARQLQLSMLPKELPNMPNLDIAVFMQTSTEVGGDYYDFHVGTDGTLTVVVGDATGHGLNAGTIVTATKSLFNSYAANSDILFTLSEISRCIKDLKFRRLSMCLSLLKIKGNVLRMSSAGMPPALIYRDNKKELEEIMLKGMPLGATNKFPYELRETTLSAGDTILLTSDGFPELFNDKKEMFGYDGVKEVFTEVAERSSEKIVEYLKEKASNWTGGKAPDDDVTFVVLKMK